MIDLYIFIAAGLVLGAVMNRLRGMVGVISFLSGGMLGAACWWVGLPIWQAVVVGALYVIGESWGWTKWINCITHEVEHKPKGQGKPLTQAMYNKAWAYPKQVDGPNYEWLMQVLEEGWDKRDYKSYVFVGMVIRGMLWWVPVFAALAYFSGLWVLCAAAALGLSMAFPIAYKWAYDTDLFGFYYLQKAETVYGAIVGVVFGVVLWWVQ